MAQNTQQFGTRNDVKRVNDVDLSGIKNQLQENAQQIATLTTLVSKIVPGNESTARVCGVCSDFSHDTDECPTLQSEDVNALNNFPGWGDHPNLMYGPKPPFSQSNQTRPFVQQNSQQQSGSSLEDLVKQLTTQIGEIHSQGVQYQKKTDTHLHHIDTQIGQISTSLSNLESQLSNRLPSQTLANPNEHAKAVTLRSGSEKEPVEKGNSDVNFDVPPFPSRFAKAKKEALENEILETLRKVEVNIPLLDAIKQIPRCMLDLGASINVMPKSVYDTLNVGPLSKTNVVIQLADRSNAFPMGVSEDVLVQVNELVFPADFYVLDIGDRSDSVPLLLGRHFLKASKTKIDVHEGNLTMEFDGEMIKFNIFDATKYPNDISNVSSIDSFDACDWMARDVFDEENLENLFENGVFDDFKMIVI
ncbi:uncharacterized protein LOC110699835 [Chenopodium quinoa]|uniref:uncharacterized protein LOC110699835 n=1 Tax=Chenopodium quinoa TaxID=63459 RepID=UPI000B785064|nr:uncharacterized protein LOC110699835 [Chenopodium quinoa]